MKKTKINKKSLIVSPINPMTKDMPFLEREYPGYLENKDKILFLSSFYKYLNLNNYSAFEENPSKAE